MNSPDTSAQHLRELGLRSFHPVSGPGISFRGEDRPHVGERVHVRRNGKPSLITYEVIGRADDPEFWEMYRRSREKMPVWLKYRGITKDFYPIRTSTGGIEFVHYANMRRPLPTLKKPRGFARTEQAWAQWQCDDLVAQEMGEGQQPNH